MNVLIPIIILQTPSKESIETLSALEIAEQMTYLDHQIFVNIRSEYVNEQEKKTSAFLSMKIEILITYSI